MRAMIEAQLEVNWKTVAEIVRQYKARRPDEYAGAVEYARRERVNLKNKFGSDGGESNRRYLCELPNYLVNCITILFPTALEGPNLIQFLKNHPEFQIPEKL